MTRRTNRLQTCRCRRQHTGLSRPWPGSRRPRLRFRGAQLATDQGPPPRLFSRQPSPSSFHAPRGPPLPVRPGAIGTREGIHAAAAATRIWSTSIPCRPHSPLRCPINHRAGRLPMAAQGAKTPRLGARTARLSDRGRLACPRVQTAVSSIGKQTQVTVTQAEAEPLSVRPSRPVCTPTTTRSDVLPFPVLVALPDSCSCRPRMAGARHNTGGLERTHARSGGEVASRTPKKSISAACGGRLSGPAAASPPHSSPHVARDTPVSSDQTSQPTLRELIVVQVGLDGDG